MKKISTVALLMSVSLTSLMVNANNNIKVLSNDIEFKSTQLCAPLQAKSAHSANNVESLKGSLLQIASALEKHVLSIHRERNASGELSTISILDKYHQISNKYDVLKEQISDSEDSFIAIKRKENKTCSFEEENKYAHLKLSLLIASN
jgi:hypothetical protein